MASVPSSCIASARPGRSSSVSAASPPAAGSAFGWSFTPALHALPVAGLLLENGHDLALGNRITHGNEDLMQGPRFLDEHRDLHLHRVDEHNRVAGRDSIADLALDQRHQPGNLRFGLN